MTDKEMATQIGLKMLAHWRRNSAMQAELMTYKDAGGNPIPWQNHVHQAESHGLDHGGTTEIQHFVEAIQGCDPADCLGTLYRALSSLLKWSDPQ